MASSSEPVGGAAGTDLRESITQLRAEMARLTEQVERFVESRGGELRQSATNAAADAEELIRGNPLSALGAAFGLGFFLGLLIAGRSDRGRSPRLSRRDFDRLAAKLQGATHPRNGRSWAAAAEDSALLDRLGRALSGLVESTRSAATAVGSAGESAAKSAAEIGGRTAKSLSQRLANAVR